MLGRYGLGNHLSVPLGWAALAFALETRFDSDMNTPSPFATMLAIALLFALIGYLASQPGFPQGWRRIWMWERVGLVAGAAMMWIPLFRPWFALPVLACAALFVATNRVPRSKGFRGRAIATTALTGFSMVLSLILALSR